MLCDERRRRRDDGRARIPDDGRARPDDGRRAVHNNKAARGEAIVASERPAANPLLLRRLEYIRACSRKLPSFAKAAAGATAWGNSSAAGGGSEAATGGGGGASAAAWRFFAFLRRRFSAFSALRFSSARLRASFCWAAALVLFISLSVEAPAGRARAGSARRRSLTRV